MRPTLWRATYRSSASSSGPGARRSRTGRLGSGLERRPDVAPHRLVAAEAVREDHRPAVGGTVQLDVVASEDGHEPHLSVALPSGLSAFRANCQRQPSAAIVTKMAIASGHPSAITRELRARLDDELAVGRGAVEETWHQPTSSPGISRRWVAVVRAAVARPARRRAGHRVGLLVRRSATAQRRRRHRRAVR